MFYLIFLFTILYFFLAWRRLDLALMLLIAALPAYLIRFSIFGLPATLLEVMIWIVFMVWAIKNFSLVKNNFLENFKKENKKIKIRYPFDREIVLLLLVALAAAGIAGFSSASLGIWKAYFFEPALLFIVVFNVINNPPPPPLRRGIKGGFPFIKGVELILWPLAISALAVSALAIYQKITGQMIANPLWAAAATRRVVSFFGYPNAVGLYLGPIVLVTVGWLASVIAREHQRPKQSTVNRKEPEIASLVSIARNDKLKAILINLTIILSILSIYFTKSKGALMGVVAGLVVFGLLAGKKIRWAVVIVLVLMGAGLAFSQPVRHQALKYLTLNDFSGQVRRAQWRETLIMLKDGRILTGAGLANYQAAIADYHAPGIFIKDFDDPDAQRKLVFNPAYRAAHWQPLEIYLYPHNIVLNFWSELGLAGVLLFIWIILKYFWLGISSFSLRGASATKQSHGQGDQRLLRSFQSLAMTDRFLVIGLIGAMIVVIIHGAADVPYFKNDLAVMFWLLVAMMSFVNLENKLSLP